VAALAFKSFLGTSRLVEGVRLWVFSSSPSNTSIPLLIASHDLGRSLFFFMKCAPDQGTIIGGISQLIAWSSHN
jgi:hypothetical protein